MLERWIDRTIDALSGWDACIDLLAALPDNF